ncbi:MAG: GHKL domain-containing protein [Saccharofermentans sp.]|nr:GHKL domain-containing protein [Saccharofermentans sp.]
MELNFKKTDKFFMISVTNPCSTCPVIVDGQIQTDKSDKKNHGFGLKNVREAASVYGGEVELSCEEKSHVCVFRTEILFNLES